MNEIKTQGKYTTIHRIDRKIIIASQEVYNHIGTHATPGKGSVFSGGITQKMINDFLVSANIPKSGGAIPANFEGGGYLLVAPFNVAMQFKDATVKPGTKEDFDAETKTMVPVPIAEVHTSQPISDFATSVTTVLVFPYDPSRSSPDQNAFVETNKELKHAKTEGNLYALATAFPGGFALSNVGGISFPSEQVPKATEWGGINNPKWAVIIPDSTNTIIERWNKLAGTK